MKIKIGIIGRWSGDNPLDGFPVGTMSAMVAASGNDSSKSRVTLSMIAAEGYSLGKEIFATSVAVEDESSDTSSATRPKVRVAKVTSMSFIQ